MARVRVLVLRAAGINCDEEVMRAWQIAGAAPVLLHVNEVARHPSMVLDYQVVTIPGGFSYGDDIAAGIILAQRVLDDLAGPLTELVERGGGILGICNGFQVLVKAGLLPGGGLEGQQVTVTFNDSAIFEARWVRLKVCTSRCVFLACPSEADNASRGDAPLLEMPVEHAEGKVVTVCKDVLRRLDEQGQIALRYVDASGRYDQYPANPNGSMGGIAGLCDTTGRIFGLMPHPDRHFLRTHHPLWTRRSCPGVPDGLRVFLNAVEYWRRESPVASGADVTA